MEAYHQRHDVTIYSTVEWTEFLLYGDPLGIIVKYSSLSQTTMEIPFSKAQGHSKLDMCFALNVLFIKPWSRLSPYVIQVILGAVSVIGTIPALVYFLFICVCLC
jgi:hypothetical protein